MRKELELLEQVKLQKKSDFWAHVQLQAIPHDPCGISLEIHTTRVDRLLPKVIFSLSFAYPIRLIPVPMVLVKMINEKFGIIEIFGNTQGYFGHFGDIFAIHL